MFGKKVDTRGLMAWALAALAAPAAQFFGSLPWTWVLAGGVLGSIAWCLIRNTRGPLPRPLLAALPVCAVPALALALRYSGACWPRVPDEIQGWALLAAAAWAALRGSAAGTRYGPVVLWITLPVYGVLLLCALPEVRIANLRPLPMPSGGNPWPLLTLLLPLGLGAFPREGRGLSWPWLVAAPLAAALLAAVCAGVMGPARAAASDGAFWILVRSLRLLGVAERFEALVSGIMTMGWFCYMTLVLSTAGEAGTRLHPRGGPWAMAGVLAAAAVLELIL